MEKVLINREFNQSESLQQACQHSDYFEGWRRRETQSRVAFPSVALHPNDCIQLGGNINKQK